MKISLFLVIAVYFATSILQSLSIILLALWPIDGPNELSISVIAIHLAHSGERLLWLVVQRLQSGQKYMG